MVLGLRAGGGEGLCLEAQTQPCLDYQQRARMLAAGTGQCTHGPPVSLYVFSRTRLEPPSSALKYLQR